MLVQSLPRATAFICMSLILTCLQAVKRVMQKRKSVRILNMISGLVFPCALIFSSLIVGKEYIQYSLEYILPCGGGKMP